MSEIAFEPPLKGTAPDYAKRSHWLRRPKKHLHAADTLYFYPTTVFGFEDPSMHMTTIDSPEMRLNAEGMYAIQATAFEEATDVYVPLWRQATLAFEKDLPNSEYEAFLHGEPRTDAFAALDYYFDHCNEGRPFFIAGHSQGSTMVNIILREYFAARRDLLERLVAAYQIGYSFVQEDLDECPWLAFATGADDTGVVVSWNTEGPKNVEIGAKSGVLKPNSIAINPITWVRDETYAPVEQNLGSLVSISDDQFEIVSPGVADARVDLGRGVVVCTTRHDFTLTGQEPEPFGPQSFHGNDFGFYYANLQQNVAIRLAAWQAAACC